jgi:transcription elongation GreA/GreB family factor
LLETKVADERAQHCVLKARADARNAKERGKRLQRRIARLEQELMQLKKE